MRSLRGLVAALALLFPVTSARAWEYSKNEEHPQGSEKVKDLKKGGEYFIVKGADLHNLGADLIGKKIRFRGYVLEINRFPVRKVLLLSEDKCYFVIMPYGKTLGKVPESLRNRILKNGFRAAGGFFKRYEGDKLTVYCTIDTLCKEGGLTGSVLRYKSCIVKPVHDWAKGWAKIKGSKK